MQHETKPHDERVTEKSGSEPDFRESLAIPKIALGDFALRYRFGKSGSDPDFPASSL